MTTEWTRNPTKAKRMDAEMRAESKQTAILDEKRGFRFVSWLSGHDVAIRDTRSGKTIKVASSHAETVITALRQMAAAENEAKGLGDYYQRLCGVPLANQ
jgi:hypothetical protein